MLALLLASAVNATPASVYGLEIGQPLPIGECAYRHAPTFKNSKLPPLEPTVIVPETGSCWSRTTRRGSSEPITDGVVTVQFPYRERLAANDQNFVAVRLLAGKVAFIRFNAKGMADQDETLAILTAKFGDPSSVEPIPLQNGFGAQFQAIHAQWKLSEGVTANYWSHGGFEDRQGLFTLGSPEGEAADAATLRLLTRPTVGL